MLRSSTTNRPAGGTGHVSTSTPSLRSDGDASRYRCRFASATILMSRFAANASAPAPNGASARPIVAETSRAFPRTIVALESAIEHIRPSCRPCVNAA